MGRLCRAVTSQIQSVSALTRVTRGSFALNSPAGAALTLVMRTPFFVLRRIDWSIHDFLRGEGFQRRPHDYRGRVVASHFVDDEVAFTVLASLYCISVALNSLSHTHTHTHIHH